MTTNVYDSNTGIMATDSRWSITYGSKLIYFDESHFSKLEIHRTTAFMFAGDGGRIQEWKDWIRSQPNGGSARPSQDGLCVCIVDTESKAVRFKQPQDITRSGGHFAGSGSRAAFSCWDVNRDAKLAVVSAINVDPYSGGEVKFVDFTSNASNLSSGPTASLRIDDVTRLVLEQGVVMELNRHSNVLPFPLSQLAAQDVEVLEAVKKIAAGELVPSAPCDGMYTEWTASQISELDEVLADVFDVR